MFKFNEVTNSAKKFLNNFTEVTDLVEEFAS